MNVVISKPKNDGYQAEIRAIDEFTKRMTADPKAAREYLIKSGFMNRKTGKLTKRYGG